MYKVAILGCENSHAGNFLNAVLKEKIVDDVEFVGVYSDEREAAEKLNREYGVAIGENYDSFVGKVDGVIITARHGDNHYKYAKPYLDSGIPMYIDKPITCTEQDAKDFMNALKERNVRVCGGSVCVLDDYVQELKKAAQEETYGKVLGGFVRAPLIIHSPYGGFFFYAQHLAQIAMEIFGNYPLSVQVVQKNNVYNCLLRYDAYDINLAYVNSSSTYYANISCEEGVYGNSFEFKDGFQKEFKAFHDLLQGKEQTQSYEDFFAPVFVLNAIYRAINSGKEEKINRIGD